jgi:hypothetical protein
MLIGRGARKGASRLTAAGIVVSDATRRLVSRLTGKDLPLPWMTALDSRAIAHIVRRTDPRYVLEWGSGHSTGRFPREAPHLERWVSIEHDAAWYERMRGRRRHRAVELALVPPDGSGAKVGNRATYKDYVAYPAGLGLRFDLVIIDGQDRLECLRATRELFSERGLVILHDAHRYDYAALLDGLGPSVELDDPRNGFRILVAGVRMDPRSVMDMAHLEGIYAAVGEMHGRLERSLGAAYLALTFR